MEPAGNTPTDRIDNGQPSVGIRELKSKASAIIDDVKERRISYAVTKHGNIEALIVPVDAGERLTGSASDQRSWDMFEALTRKLQAETPEPFLSALDELDGMRR